MTPLGHLSISIIASKKIYNKGTITLLYIIIGGVIPDIDFLSYFFSNLNNFHRTYTHSIGFLIICLIIIFIFKKEKANNILLAFSIGFILHLIVDAGLDSNYSNGIGIPMLWPLYNGYIYWFKYFIRDLEVISSPSWENPIAFISSKLFDVLLIEIPFYIYAIILFKKKKNA